ncbi:M56 family metallopeptidase [Mycolicibacterium sp. A43C]
MTIAAYLLAYGAVMIWAAPALLHKLTGTGLNPRLGVAAWLTAIAVVVLAWSVSVLVIMSAAVSGLPGSATIVLCLETIGVPERSLTPGATSLALLIGTGVVISTMVGIRVGRAVAGFRAHSAEHARAARIIGVPTDRQDVFVIDADRAAAYCVAGRPHAIVLTSAAVRTLDEAQLGAVLAHEQAHLAGRHHHLLMVLRALSHSLSRLPLFTRAVGAVAALLEMCADDTAARRHGRGAVIAGMVKLAGPAPVGGLSVGACAVHTRVARLSDPAGPLATGCHQILTIVVIAATVGVPVLINLLCQH